MIRLRPFTEGDVEILRQGQGQGMSPEEIRAMIAEWNAGTYRGKPFEMYAVEADGAVAGHISLLGQSRSIASVGVEILPEERRKGYAAGAVEQLLALAAQRGCRVIQNQVAADNVPGIALHEKLGFETGGYVYRNARGREVLIYVKCLSLS